MRSSSIPISNISFKDHVFSSGKPFEEVNSDQGLSIVRTRRSPLIGSGNQVSVSSHLQDRTYYWFGSTPNWNVTIINSTGSFITFSQVNIIPQHVSGRNATVNITNTGIVSSSQTFDTFSPLISAASNLRMDTSGGISMFFDIVVPAVSPPPSNIFIQFNWGGFHSQSGTVLLGEALRTPTRTFSSWGNNRGVNVTVTLT